MPRLYFALDLHNDPALIGEYEYWHRPENIWSAVLRSLQGSGINELELFRCGNRLVQVLDVAPGFSLADKQANDVGDPDIQAWEHLMWRFQQALPFADAGQKWVPMTRMFSLRQTLGVRRPE